MVNSFFLSLKKRFPLFSGIISFFMLVFGVAGAMLAASGVCFFCWIPVLSFVLGLFGLTTGTLLDYNVYFLVLGVVFLLLSWYLYHRRKCSGGVCKL